MNRPKPPPDRSAAIAGGSILAAFVPLAPSCQLPPSFKGSTSPSAESGSAGHNGSAERLMQQVADERESAYSPAVKVSSGIQDVQHMMRIRAARRGVSLRFQYRSTGNRGNQFTTLAPSCSQSRRDRSSRSRSDNGVKGAPPTILVCSARLLATTRNCQPAAVPQGEVPSHEPFRGWQPDTVNAGTSAHSTIFQSSALRKSRNPLSVKAVRCV
jgi:hypothetical protein